MTEWKWVPEDGCPSGCPEQGHYEDCPFDAFLQRKLAEARRPALDAIRAVVGCKMCSEETGTFCATHRPLLRAALDAAQEDDGTRDGDIIGGIGSGSGLL